MNKKNKFDLLIIGSGPAGFAAAMKAFDYGKIVCIVEAKHIGGAGIMHGALTSKTMYELSHEYDIAASKNRGFSSIDLTVDYDKVLKTVLNAAKLKQRQILSQIQTFSKSKHGKGSLTLKYGHASFMNNNEVEIINQKQKEILEADFFLIATGSSPKDYPGLNVDQRTIINSEGILNLKRFPERILIIGSGIIGCEFANIFSCFKQTEVHLLDRTHRVLPNEDDDVADFVSKQLEQNGAKIHYTANLKTINKKTNSLEVILDYIDGHSKVLEIDIVLIAIGRQPNTNKLGLENTGVKVNNYGYIELDKNLCAITDNNIKNIYAAGDVAGKGQFFSIAELQGRYAVRQMFDKHDRELNYSNVSTLMFFKPLVAAVGMNEKALQNDKIPYRMAWYSNQLVNPGNSNAEY